MFITLLRVFRIKKMKLYIFILTFLFFIINVIGLLINSANTKINDEIINKLENRIIYIHSHEKDKIDVIKTISNIENVYYNLEPFLVNYNEDEKLYFKHINPLSNIKIISGKSNNLNSNEIIIPNTLFKNEIR